MDQSGQQLNINLDVSQKAMAQYKKLSVVSPLQLRDVDKWTLQKPISEKSNPLGIVSQPRLREAVDLQSPRSDSSMIINSFNKTNQAAIQNFHQKMIDEALLMSKIPNSGRYQSTFRKKKTEVKTNKVIEKQTKKQFEINQAVKQLYKDVEDDHQEHMLNSSIYITGDDSSYHRTGQSQAGQVRGFARSMSRNKMTGSNLNNQSTKYGISYDKQDYFENSNFQSSGQYLPDLKQHTIIDGTFQNTFKSNALNVTIEVQKNINIEKQKFGFPQIDTRKRADLNEMMATAIASELSRKIKVGAKKAGSGKASVNKMHITSISPESSMLSNIQIEENFEITQTPDQNVLFQQLNQNYKYKPAISRSKSKNARSVSKRSQSVSMTAGTKKNLRELPIHERQIFNSQSRILKMLTQGNNSDDGQDQKFSAYQSLKVSPSRLKIIKLNEKREAEKQPKLDLKSIKLERDFIDKDSLEKLIKDQKTDGTKLMQSKQGELEPAEQIERIRRILVLEQMGLDIPRNVVTGEVDDKKLFEVQLPGETTPSDKGKEDGYNPLFPLKPTTNLISNKMEIPGSQTFDKNIKEILTNKDDLEDFAEKQKMEKQLKLKLGIFSERMSKGNKYIDYTFKDASEAFLNEENLIKQIRDQIESEGNVQGKLLFRSEETEYD